MTGSSIEKTISTQTRPTDDADLVPEEAAPSEPPSVDWSSDSLARRFLRPRTLLSFVLAAAIVVFALSRFNLNLSDVLSQMRRADPLYLALAFATYYGSFALRSARWRSLLRSARVEPEPGKSLPSTPTMMTIYVLSWFVNCIVPAKLGDAYRGFLLKQRSGVSFGATLGTIFAERLSDLITLAVVLVGSGLLVFGRHAPANVTNWMMLAIAIGLGLALSIVIVYRFRLVLRGFIPHRVRHHYIKLEEGALGSFGRWPTLVSLSAVIWLSEGIRLYFVGESVNAGLSFTAALFISLFASLLTAIPITPAGLGFVEFGVVGLMTLMGSSEQTAASVTFLDRFVAYWSVILVGAIAYLITRWVWRKG